MTVRPDPRQFSLLDLLPPVPARVPEANAHTARDFAIIAEEAWQALDLYDRTFRTEGAVAALDTGALDRFRALEIELNDGTSFGVAVNPAPRRLMRAMRVRARAERRLPMWGVEGRFRFECRGMPVIVDTKYWGFHIDRDRVRPGSPCWSETGYRSMGYGPRSADGDTTPEGYARAMLESYIDAKPRKDGGGGLGGKLKRWWPMYVLTWQQDTSWSLRMDRATTWNQWGPEKHAETWAAHDQRRADAMARMLVDGIDPNDVGRWQHHKGSWPKFNQEGLL